MTDYLSTVREMAEGALRDDALDSGERELSERELDALAARRSTREPALAAFALRALAVVAIVQKYRDPCREHSCPYHGEMNAALSALTADAEPKQEGGAA